MSGNRFTDQMTGQQMIDSHNGNDDRLDTAAAKLGGIAAGATLNDTDANLKNRANHTGVQAIVTVDQLQSTLDSKATSVDIESALDANALVIDSDTARGKYFPIPGPGDPAIGTDSNPLVIGGGTAVNVVDQVQVGNANPVTSNAVAVITNSLTGSLNTLSGGSTRSVQQVYDQLYDLISSGQIIPAKDTNPVTDSVARSFNWTNNSDFPNFNQREYTLDGGNTIAGDLTSKPLIVGNGAYAINMVGVRIKAVPGTSTASNWLFNDVAFTSVVDNGDMYAPGHSPADITNGKVSADPVNNGDGTWTTPPDTVINVTTRYNMPVGAEIGIYVSDNPNVMSRMQFIDSFTVKEGKGIYLNGGVLSEYSGNTFTPFASQFQPIPTDKIVARYVQGSDPNSYADRELLIFKVSEAGVYTLLTLPSDRLNYVNTDNLFYVSWTIDTVLDVLYYPSVKGCTIDTEAI